jgi:hypothetical protein
MALVNAFPADKRYWVESIIEPYMANYVPNCTSTEPNGYHQGATCPIHETTPNTEEAA